MNTCRWFWVCTERIEADAKEGKKDKCLKDYDEQRECRNYQEQDRAYRDSLRICKQIFAE